MSSNDMFSPTEPIAFFTARHADYGGWIITFGEGAGRKQAAFTSFDEMIGWLTKQTRFDAGPARVSRYSSEAE